MIAITKKYYSEKISFIQSLLDLLPFHKWDNELLSLAEAECNFSDGYNTIIFPNGLKEIIDFFEEWQDSKMLEGLTKLEAPVKVREKIGLALKIRIKESGSKIVHIKNSAYFAYPANIIFAAKLAFRTCDIIWRYAGDKSLDHNYYTKRGLLLAVYISAIAFYIQDESENYSETDIFIDDSLSEIIQKFSKIACCNKFLNPSNLPIIRLFT